MVLWYDVMVKHTTSIHKGKHDKAHKSHQTALRFLGQHEVQVLPSFKSLPSRVASSVIGGNRTDCFLSWFAYVAVSKSRHRLLCSPTWKGQKHSKIPSLICLSVREVDL